MIKQFYAGLYNVMYLSGRTFPSSDWAQTGCIRKQFCRILSANCSTVTRLYSYTTTRITYYVWSDESYTYTSASEFQHPLARNLCKLVDM